MTEYLIGLDFGSASARGVLVDVDTGLESDAISFDYPHGTLTTALPDGTALGRSWALQVATDYEAVTASILDHLGRGRRIRGIGLGFTASSPMPTTADGVPLSVIHPGDPHAYVKLWKHGAAQAQADRLNAQGSAHFARFGGKVSAEWLLAKAAQIAEESPESWARTARFIEAGDWLVWRLVGQECRSLGFAAFKAQYHETLGYPDRLVPGLSSRLSAPNPVGTSAGHLTEAWCNRTGIVGPCSVAVAVIDSHVVLPAIGAVDDGCFVAALGTSAVSMMLSECELPLPKGIEGAAYNASMRNLWCYEAGQASFGDTLNWFVQAFPRGPSPAESFDAYNREAAILRPGQTGLLALDWWNGNRVPMANSQLSGLILGLRNQTKPVDIYRTLMESLCFGMRSIYNLYVDGGFKISRIVMTSGLAQRNPFLVQMMSNVIGRAIEVPNLENATAIGAAIHGAVASGVVDTYRNGAARFGAKSTTHYRPDSAAHAVYNRIFRHYRTLVSDRALQEAMIDMGALQQDGQQTIIPSTEREAVAY